jgi:hypothetical protein
MQQDPEDTLNRAPDAAGAAADNTAEDLGDAADNATDDMGDAAQGSAEAVEDMASAMADTPTESADSAADLGSQAVAATGDTDDGGPDASDAAAAAVAGAAVASTAGAGDAVGEAQATVDQAIQTATSPTDSSMTTSPSQPPAQTSTGDLTTPHHRPAGISVLGTIAVLWGLLNLFIAPLAAAGTMIFGDGMTAGLWTGTIGFVAGLVWLAIGFGFFKLKAWVWLLSLLVAAVSLLQVIASVVTDPTSTVCGLFGLIVPAIFLWYLTRPHVKAAFGR